MVRAVHMLLFAAVGIFVASTIPGARSARGFDQILDGWLQGSAYALAAVSGLLRVWKAPAARVVWVLLSASLTTRAVGFILYFTVVRQTVPLPYPSVSDVAWLISTTLLIVGLAMMVRREAVGVSLRLVLDGLIGALAVAAFFLAFLYGTLASLAAPDLPGSVVAVNLAYPLLDVILLVVAGGLLLARNWIAPPSVWVLVVGVFVWTINDAIFLYQVTVGSFRPGTVVPALSLLSTAAIASSMWLPQRHGQPDAAPELPRLLVPSALALACLGLLTHGAVGRLPVAAVVAAAAALAVALARAGMSFHTVRAVAEHERRSRNAELRFRSAVDASPDAIFGVDAAGRITFSNAAARQIFGTGPRSVEGRSIDDLIEPALSTRCRDLLDGGRPVPSGRPAFVHDHRWRLPDGTDLPVEIRLSVMVDVTGASTVLVTARDITDRIALEAERQDRAEANQRATADRLERLGEFAAGVAHDFNNVLAVIASYSTIIGRRSSDPGLASELAAISTAAQQGAALTQQLQVFARETPTVEQPVSIDGLVETVVAMLQPTLPADVTVIVELDGRDAEVVGDPHQIERVLLNLALNARDAMGGSGTLTVQTCVAAETVVVSVADTGHGMTAAVRDRAFEPFFSTKPRGQGTGLGLATAYGIAVQHGGSLEISSEPGTGTTVKMRLPRR